MNAAPSPVKQRPDAISFRQGNLPLRIWGSAAVALLVIAGSLAWTSHDEYEKTLEQEYRFLENHARFGDVQMAGALRSIDLLLQDVIDAKSSTPDLPADFVQRRQLSQLMRFPEIGYLITTDHMGQVATAESLDDPIGVTKVRKFDASQRDYFTVHRGAKPEDHYRYRISRPSKAITDRNSITISRAIRSKSGQFQGVALAALSPTHFDSILQQVLASHGVDAVAVHNRLGDIIYRRPDLDKYVGKNIADGEAFKLYLRSDQKLTRYLGVTATDNVKRMLVFSKVGDTDLDVGVSVRFDAVLAQWRSNVLAKALIFVLLAGLTLALAWGAQRYLLERRRNDAALHESEQRFRTLLQSIPSVAVQGYAQDGTTRYWNAASESLYGYSAEEAIGRNLIDLIIPAEMHTGVRSAMREMFETGEPIPAGELSLMRKDGSRVDVFSSHALVKGQLPEMFCVDVDLTERKQAEKALRENEERWKFAIEGSGDGVWDWNLQTGEATFSKRWKEMLGWAESEIGNSSEEWVKRVCPEDLPGVMANINAHLEQKTAAAAVEFRMLTKGGGWKWILGRGIVVSRDAEGKPLRLVGTNTDITERKQAEAARAALEAQLRESQKMEALGTLAGGVAHDFNNALATILGNVELARQDIGPDHAALVSLEEIGKASRRAKDMVQQILAFGRRQTLDRKATSLSLVVIESARLIRATLPADIALDVVCKPDAPAVLADAAQIKQILLNLCQNAAHAVQGQGRPGVIGICLVGVRQVVPGEGLRPGHYACLSVRDNGTGMDEATRSHIFEPFFTTKPKGKGTGLGLSVAHGIAQAHEASIEMDSSPGKGSEFRIYFPACALPVLDDARSSQDAAHIPGEGRHVLYVDDEEAIIFLMTRLLERQGYRVSGYTDPREALAAARANAFQFDLAVTDYSMPGMDGLAFASALREIRADLPVVLASGYITEELRQKAPAAGVRELIYKPNTVDDLCDAVARFARATRKPRNT